MVAYIRVLVGVGLGLAAGLVFTLLVIIAKIGFFVNSPRDAHPLLLLSFFVVPAVAGGLIGLLLRRRP